MKITIGLPGTIGHQIITIPHEEHVTITLERPGDRAGIDSELVMSTTRAADPEPEPGPHPCRGCDLDLRYSSQHNEDCDEWTVNDQACDVCGALRGLCFHPSTSTPLTASEKEEQT